MKSSTIKSLKNRRDGIAKDIEAFIARYRPKVIREYEENGCRIRVYEEGSGM